MKCEVSYSDTEEYHWIELFVGEESHRDVYLLAIDEAKSLADSLRRAVKKGKANEEDT